MSNNDNATSSDDDIVRPTPMSEADKTLLELVRTFLTVQEDSEILGAVTGCITADTVRSLSLPTQVYLREFLKSRSVAFPDGLFVVDALLSILPAGASPSPVPTPATATGTQDARASSGAPSVNEDPLIPAPMRNLETRIDSRLSAISTTVANLAHHISNIRDTPAGENSGPARNRFPQEPPEEYSSIGAIPRLPVVQSVTADPKASAKASSLLKLFSYSSQQFSGTGDLTENLAAYHQSYADKCKSLGLTAQEAFDCLYILFAPSSPASIYYHKNVLPQAKNMDEAFRLLYSRFMSSERRDRLIRQWNSLKFSAFRSKADATNQSALLNLYQTASTLQLQLGPAYQSDQHLRDTIQKAVLGEPFAAFLTLSPTADSLSLQESCARAIQVMEDQQAIVEATSQKASVVPAHAHETLFTSHKQHTTERPGMHSRRYAHDNRRPRDRFKTSFANWRVNKGNRLNPMRNGVRMRCRNCNSEHHFIRDCDQLTDDNRIYLAREILLVDSVSDDDLGTAMDMIQDLDDDTWSVFHSKTAPTNPIHKTHYVTIPTDNRQMSTAFDPVYASLSDISFSHSLLHKTCDQSHFQEHHQILFSSRNDNSGFEGICMDNGAQKSLAGYPAYKRYCRHAHVVVDMRLSSARFKLGDVIHQSLGIATIRVPIDDNGNYLEYTTDVVDVDIPILFGLDNMKELKWYTNEVTNEFCSQVNPDLKVPLKAKLGHLYLEWPSSTVLFTRSDLLKLHRRFSHPSTEKLMNVLRRASADNYSPDTKKLLDDIVARCNSCQRMAPKPFVFQVTLPDNIVFNHEIFMDLMWLDVTAESDEKPSKRPVLHIVDRGTHFSAARFLAGESAETVWNTFIECWVSIYIGFPNVLTHDQGSLFNSEFFTSGCAQFGIVQKPTPTESHNSLGPGERYHAPLRKIYTKIRIEYPSLSRITVLSLAVHALNNTAGPDGLIPTLLVFGTIPKLPLGNIETELPTQRDRFAALESARKEMETIVAKQRVKLALKPRTKSMEVFNIPPGSPVLVYREKAKCWKGPYTLYKYDNYKTAYVQINGLIQPFSITVVKPYMTEPPPAPVSNDVTEPSGTEQTEAGKNLDSLNSDPDNQSTVPIPPTLAPPTLQQTLDYIRQSSHEYQDTSNSIYVVIVNDPEDPRFRQSSHDEIKGLLDRGTYVVVNEESVPPGATILRARVVHSIKTDDNGDPVYKTRLVIQGHRDPEKLRVVSEAPAILRSSCRVIVALSQALGLPLWTRDVRQAFVQSDNNLDRRLYVRLPRQPELLPMIGLPNEGLLHAIKPLYGLTESPGYWWHTFKRYHTTELGMIQTVMDPCLFFKKENEELMGVIGTLVDDTLGFGTPAFAEMENEQSSRFDVKPRQESFPMKFNGCVITEVNGMRKIHQQEYTATLVRISISNFTPDDFSHLRGQVAYISTSTRPDSSFASAQLAQVKPSIATANDVRLLNSVVAHLQSNPRGIVFPKLDLDSIVIRGYADASFANNVDTSSQLGMAILLCDKDGNASLIHYASWKCRRVTRSVLAAEVYALSACYDFAYTLSHDISTLLGKSIPIQLFTDSKSIFDTITKLSTVSEKRLLIDIAALRQAYATGEIDNIGHISTAHNIADPLTKKMNSPLLTSLLETGKLNHPVNQWIIHEPNTEK